MIMTRKLQFLFAALLLSVGVTSAWADNTVTVNNGTTTENFETLNAAFGASIVTGATTDLTVIVSADQTISTRLTWEKAKTMTITATKDITIKGPSDHIWILVKTANSILNIGNDSYKITFDGENTAMTFTEGIVQRNDNGTLNLTNVKFKDFNLNNKAALCYANNANGKVTFEKVTITNCKNPQFGLLYNYRPVDDIFNFKGYLNIDNDSKGVNIYQRFETKNDNTRKGGRLKVLGTFNASKQISIVFHEISSYRPKTGIVMISSSAVQDLSAKFSATSDNLSPIAIKYNGSYDMNLAQAYNLELGAAGAATMVLPFEATIPSGANCYTLDYASGDDITATKVTGGTLAANTPVLVIGTADTPYLFETTAAASTTIEAIPGSEQTSGVLKGVYTETTPANTNYILSYKGEALAFRKADGSTNKVQPYHAYMSVTHSGPNPAPAFYNINFGGITGISNLKVEQNMMDDENAPIYNLQGVRMNSQNLPKGIYVKNGRKFIVK